jgi:ribosomal protein L31E
MIQIIMEPKRLEAFVTYLQAVVARQFPHDTVHIVLDANKELGTALVVKSANEKSRARRIGEIRGFINGLMKAPCIFSKSDIQCAIYLATPDRPAEKLPV